MDTGAVNLFALAMGLQTICSWTFMEVTLLPSLPSIYLNLSNAIELMDAIYLHNKFSKPCSWDTWCKVRKIADYVCKNWRVPDMYFPLKPFPHHLFKMLDD